MTVRGQACGKLILAGEYSVLFGGSGIAAPVNLHCDVSIDVDQKRSVSWQQPADVHALWNDYLTEILTAFDCQNGRITVNCTIPLGKGLGSSTALVVAVGRALGQSDTAIRAVEDQVNPGHSGIDIGCILAEAPVRFQAGSCQPESLHFSLADTILIDSGTPAETTKELVAWVRSNLDTKKPALSAIAEATDQLLSGEDLASCLRQHHRAQLALGVVPPLAAGIIDQIEQAGGSAKIVGAGGRSGGGGMIWCTGLSIETVNDLQVSYLPLS